MNPVTRALPFVVLAVLAALTVTPSLAALDEPPDAGAQASGRPLVRTGAGWVRGVAADGHVTFSGIPYAAPPVGERRWAPPGPVTPWRGVRDARVPGPVCPQMQFGDEGQVATGDEDCLYLNVTVPRRGRTSHGGRRLPVVVFLRPLRRRPPQHHGRRPVLRGQEHLRPPGLARLDRPLRQGDLPERPLRRPGHQARRRPARRPGGDGARLYVGPAERRGRVPAGPTGRGPAGPAHRPRRPRHGRLRRAAVATRRGDAPGAPAAARRAGVRFGGGRAAPDRRQPRRHPPLRQNPDLTPAQMDLSATMVRQWSRFAATGSPNGRGLPEWAEHGGTGVVQGLAAGEGGVGPTPSASTHQCDYWSTLP